MKLLKQTFLAAVVLTAMPWALATLIYSCGHREELISDPVDPESPVALKSIYAPGWPAYGYTGSVKGHALPSEQLFREMGGPAKHKDSICQVFVPYEILEYQFTRDRYDVSCAAINVNGERVIGRWNGVPHEDLWGADMRHPVSREMTCLHMATANGLRFAPGGTVYYAMLLDLRDGSLRPKHSKQW